MFQHGLLLVGCEKGQVLMYSTTTFDKLHELDTGTVRYSWYFRWLCRFLSWVNNI